MMRHRARRVGLATTAALLAVVTLAATACGGRDDDSGSGSTTTAKEGGSSSAAFIDPSVDCTDYQGTEGINGDTIKIGTVRPASGTYAIYDQVTTGLNAWVTYVNQSGGLKAKDGKSYKLELIKEDDAYDPAKTPALVKKLVEQDKVFALVGDIGTEPNLSVRDYLNEKCVPNIALATGSTQWGNNKQYPWYIAGLPSYATEAHAWIEYLKESNPKAKIALLYQDDDFGQAYEKAIKKAIKGTDITIVAEQGFNPLGGTTPEAAVTKLSQSDADTFIVGLGGTPCPTSLKLKPDTWKPATIVSVTCAGKTALSLAGGKDQGVIAAQATYDPSDPADAQVPAVQQFRKDATAAGLTEQQIDGGITGPGWGFGSLFGLGIENAETLDRAGVMNALWSLDTDSFGLVRDGVTVITDGTEDPWAIEGFRIVQREGDGWKELSPITNWEGESNSFAG
ncbi:MAG TPA: ABC transporter substrate-binding protein [Microthrixaceae bacterium]|nr:ABC transporter substrate-binding protein [Microthrixaceae bacterium]